MRYGFVYQSDNNLVLYDLKSGKALWAGNTCCAKPGKAGLLQDGTMSVTDKTNNKQWTEVGNAHPGPVGAFLVVDNQGSVKICNGDNNMVKLSINKAGKIIRHDN